MFERTDIGLDVHALSVAGCAIDGVTGEIFRRRLTPDFGEILAWIVSLPGPVKAVYERPHGSLDGMTPKRYWETWTQENKLAIA